MAGSTRALVVFLTVLLGLMSASGLAIAATPSCGCGQDPPGVPGRDIDINISPDEYPGVREGSYRLHVPDNYDPNTPMPMVLGLHGWTSSGQFHAQSSAFATTADTYGLVAAWPDAVNYPVAGRGWAFPGCNASPPVGQIDSCGRRPVCSIGDSYFCDDTTCTSNTCASQCSCSDYECDTSACECVMDLGTNCNWCGCVDDEAFLRAVVEDISRKMCVDLDRVYATGMSAGGMMTSWMVAQMEDVFSAYAPVSGTNPRDFFDYPEVDADIGVMWVHGTQDSVVPHDGQPASDGYFYESAVAEAARLAAFFQCDIVPATWPVPSNVQAPGNASLSCTQHPNCPEAYPGSGTREIGYCLWSGGHTWPKSGGSQESALWGNRLITEFFLRHSKEATPRSCPALFCVPPDQPVIIENITLSTDGNDFPVLTIQDPNQQEQVTGYNIYRSQDPALEAGSWDRVVSDILDRDTQTPNGQVQDTSGDPLAPGAVFYYDGAAFNSHCPAEGPR